MIVAGGVSPIACTAPDCLIEGGDNVTAKVATGNDDAIRTVTQFAEQITRKSRPDSLPSGL